MDRSGAYIVRQAAKSIVAAGLARRVIVQVSYAIGVAQPLSVHVDSYGTGKIPDKQILAKVLEKFDFRPGALRSPEAWSVPFSCAASHASHLPFDALADVTADNVLMLQTTQAAGAGQAPLCAYIAGPGTGPGSGPDLHDVGCCGGAGMMARNLDLLRGGNRYLKTAAYGHFGRDDLDAFTWEKVPPPSPHTHAPRAHTHAHDAHVSSSSSHCSSGHNSLCLAMLPQSITSAEAIVLGCCFQRVCCR